jgi:ComF family protein
MLCAACRNSEMSFDRARSFGLYRDLLRAAVLLLKYQRCARWGAKLGTLLAAMSRDLVASRGVDNALIIPVPLHAARERERGYNQAELLSLGLARTVRGSGSGAVMELKRAVLIKVRATPPQTGLSPAARRENVRGTFAVRRPERIWDRVIVLVDDVMTTGETLSACASALKSAGAREVLALTLARATPQFPDIRSDHDRVHVDDFMSRRR